MQDQSRAMGVMTMAKGTDSQYTSVQAMNGSVVTILNERRRQASHSPPISPTKKSQSEKNLRHHHSKIVLESASVTMEKESNSKPPQQRHVRSASYPRDVERQAATPLPRGTSEPANILRSKSTEEQSHNCDNTNRNPPIIKENPQVLCLSPHVSSVEKAAAVVGWQVHVVYTHQEAVEAIHSRAYQALIIGFGTLSKEPYCSPLVGYAQQAAPSMYRLVYSQQTTTNTPLPRDLVQSCFASGADAVAWSLQTLTAALCGLIHFHSVIPAGTKIAAHQRAIYSAYAPLRHAQQRQDQLVCIANGNTTTRVRKLSSRSKKLELQLCHVPSHFIQTVSSCSHYTKRKQSIRVVHVSDSNNHHRSLTLPAGDLFLHTGNFTNPNESKANALLVFCDFLDWIAKEVAPKFELVVFIAGNHDDILASVQHSCSLKENLQAKKLLLSFLKQHKSVRYLENAATLFHDLVIYGSPTVYCRAGASQHYEQQQQQLQHAFEQVHTDAAIQTRQQQQHFEGVDIFLTNRAPSILSSGSDDQDYALPMDGVYASDGKRSSTRPPTLHAFGHCNANFGIGYYHGTVMMNGSQELLHSLDPYGGGTPLVVDIPIESEEDLKRQQRMCGGLLFHRHAAAHESSIEL